MNLKEKAVEEYVADLLVWNFPSDAKAVERGTELGLMITDKTLVAVVNINLAPSSSPSCFSFAKNQTLS